MSTTKYSIYSDFYRFGVLSLSGFGSEIEIVPNKNGNRSEQWKSVRTNGNRSEQMEIGAVPACPSPQYCTKYEEVRTTEIGPNIIWKSVRTNGNRSEQTEIDPNKRNRSEQMEIGPNKKWKSIRNHFHFHCHCHCHFFRLVIFWRHLAIGTYGIYRHFVPPLINNNNIIPPCR